MGQSQSIEICVPDIGDFDEVEVVEILVAKGDTVEVDDALISIESEKATMEIPSPAAGIIAELRVAEGDRVSEGSVLVLLEVDASISAEAKAPSSNEPNAVDTATKPTDDEALDGAGATTADSSAVLREDPPSSLPSPLPSSPPSDSAAIAEKVADLRARALSPDAAYPVPDRPGSLHASPLVRRYARELGVPLEEAEGSGPHDRILVDDLKRRVREKFADGGGSHSGGGMGIPAMPVVDFSAFGPIREQPLTRIQKVSGPGLHRSWLNVPHVTQHDEADVTELERFRKQRRDAANERGVKLSPLLFVMKAVVGALKEFPTLRSSLAPEGDRLFIKDYFHLGIAVDTDQGLVVPVIRDVEQKGIFELAEELNATAERARNRKLGPDDMRGAVFTISSLGGIGGTAFSPIVNAPEVAVLGLSKSRVQPVWRGASPIDRPLDTAIRAATSASLDASGHATSDLTMDALPDAPVAGRAATPAASAGRFEPRLILPLSLSYDHRVVDGAEAVRFTTHLTRILADPLMLLL